MGKRKSPGGLGKKLGKEGSKKSGRRVDDLLEMFYKERQRRADEGRNDTYDEIVTELLFLILFDLDGLRTLLSILGGCLFGVVITSLLL